MLPHPTLLENEIVALHPLAAEHFSGLLAQAQEPLIWRYFRTGSLEDPQRLKDWIEQGQVARQSGREYPFAIFDQASGRIAGSTRFREIDPANRCLEIGGTWLGRNFRGTAINRNAKFLLLQFAFESWRAIRVQFRTDLRNERSQKSIERLGALREGVFRKNFIYADGYQRSTVFYSITDDEWPRVRDVLLSGPCPR